MQPALSSEELIGLINKPVDLTRWYEQFTKRGYTVETIKPMEEDLRLLTEARKEIAQLRRDNELMKARLDMFDLMISYHRIQQPANIVYQPMTNLGGYGTVNFPKDLLDQMDEFINARSITDKVLKDNGEKEQDMAASEAIPKWSDFAGKFTGKP